MTGSWPFRSARISFRTWKRWKICRNRSPISWRSSSSIIISWRARNSRRWTRWGPRRCKSLSRDSWNKLRHWGQFRLPGRRACHWHTFFAFVENIDMAQLVSDFIVGRLIAWGVKRIYGYPGDGINGVMEALNRAKGKIDFIQSRHEEMAAFMACAHAKFTGEVGVCMSTSGPGAIHLLNGLYDAKMDHQPVVAIVGQQARMSMGGDYQQEVDLISLFKDVAHEYVHMATEPTQVRHMIDRAIRIARTRRTVTCVILP